MLDLLKARFRRSVAYADWSNREYATIVRCVLSAQVHVGPAPAQLAQFLQSMYAPSGVHLLNSAHHGIEMALHMFARQRPERREVIVPAYICPSVPRAVTTAGLHVCYVDVQEDLNLSVDAVRAAIGRNTLAVIAPHMYGSPAPIVEIEALCRASDIFLVDDAAQVVGVRVDGRLLGTFGDVGVISFAQSKAVVTGIRGSGGVLLVNRERWLEEAERMCAVLPMSSGRLGALIDFLWNYLGHVYTGHSGYYIDRAQTLFGLHVPKSDKATRISNLEAAIALVQWSRQAEMQQNRHRIIQEYHDALLAQTELAFPQYAPGRYLARVVLRLPTGVDPTKTRRALRDAGIETRGPYAMQACSKPGGGCERLIGMPTHADLNKTDIDYICAALHKAIVSPT